MNFTPEQLAKAKAANSIEELLAYAKENGYPLADEEAKTFFEKWHTEGELADEELDAVSGGGCGTDPHENEDYKTAMHCSNCDWTGWYKGKWNDGGWYECRLCHQQTLYGERCCLSYM